MGFVLRDERVGRRLLRAGTLRMLEINNQLRTEIRWDFRNSSLEIS